MYAIAREESKIPQTTLCLLLSICMRTLILTSRTRRNIQLAKVIFNFASENKFRKDGNHNTRAMDTYVFDTDIVRLGNYSNSP